MSPVVDIQRRMMELGRLRMGEKGPKGEPRKLTTWRLTSASRALLEAAAAEYGGTVTAWEGAPDEGYFQVTTDSAALDVILPPVFSDADGSPTLPYSQWYELWSGGGCQRRCDGITEVLSNRPCLCAQDERECDITTRLNVMLPKVPGLGVWRLESKGWNAATVLPATLDVLMLAASRQQFIPAVLRIQQETKKVPGQGTRRFVVPVIDLPDLRVGEMLEAARQGALPVNAPRVAPDRPALPAAQGAPAGEPFEIERSPGFGAPPPLPAEPEGAVVMDDESGSAEPVSEPERAPSGTITQAQRARLFAIASETGVDRDELKAIVREVTGSESTSGMRVAEYEAVVAAVQARAATV